MACYWAWQRLILEAVWASSLGTDGRGGGEMSPPSVRCPRKGFKSQACKKEEMYLFCSGFEACRSLLEIQGGLAWKESPSLAMKVGTVCQRQGGLAALWPLS